MLTKESIEEFIKIYKEVYGLELDISEATDKATRLMLLVRAVYKQIPIG